MARRVAVYQPDIAANLGALIRTAACFGAPVDVIEPCGFPFSVKALRRAVMDYGELAEVTHHASWSQFYKDRPDGRLVLLTTKGSTGLFDFQFAEGDTLLLGQESAGVPDHVAEVADARIAIPMPGGGRSLNVSVAGAIAMAEAMRQLGPLGEA